MKNLLFACLFLLFGIESSAQLLKPASWRFEISKKEAKAGESVELIFYATLEKDWYLYSSDFDPELGPTVTTFTFKPNDSYELAGKIKPIKPKKKYDDLWGGEYTYFTEKAQFRQTVKVLKANPKIEGTIDYQVCSEVDGKCIPNVEDFSFSPGQALVQAGNDSLAEQLVKKESITAISQADEPAQGVAEGKSKPAKKVEESPLKENTVGTTSNDAYSLGSFMLVAFLSGLVALLTPCVFPMVPMTVTFFTSRSHNRAQAISKAALYGVSIVVLYILIGTVVSLINGPAFANFLSTHWLPNVFFFATFVFFALSFLGMFDLTLPGTLITKVDAQADRGGYIGIFFMAFTIVLVSFSCTGPIVGSILIESAGGQVIKPVLGMFAFSMAFALPFSLFAIFPNWLKSLPKSGGWLNTVKVVLGFLELALALKFLSVADQVYHWGILDREVFLAFWIVIFSLIGFYLLGKIRLPNDEKVDHVSVPRTMLAALTFTFVVYLVPGMFGAPLKSLAGYLPPQTSQDFDLSNPSPSGYLAANQVTHTLDEKPKYSEFLKLPHGLQGFFDYKQALAYAKKVNKPLFIDFTGHGCVNCREMEARVWSQPQILKRLSNDYVVLALYVDDKFELPESDYYTSSYDGKVKKTIGAQNADLQITKFNNNAQPYYCLVDPEGNLLLEPKSYDLNTNNFADFLDKGIKQFKQASQKVSMLK